MKRPEIHTSKKEGNKSLTIRNIVERLTISSTSINIYLKKKIFTLYKLSCKKD